MDTQNGDGRMREHVEVGDTVQVVLKKDQGTGNLTEGSVVQILTNSNFHPHGIKVKLKSGKVGRVKIIL